MAIERKFGLAAILSFTDKASPKMKRVGDIAKGMSKNLRGMVTGVRDMGMGISQLGRSLLPATAAFGLMIRDGSKFEDAMAKLRAVTLDTTGDLTAGMKSLSKTLGTETKFSATEAALSMVELSRSGMMVDEVMQSARGTLMVAAAEGISMAESAKIVVSNLKAFGLEASKANMVGGTLALVSARTNTNMTLLQEGLKMVGPVSRLAGFSFKDTALNLGLLADMGIRGTLSGTAMRTAMFQLLKPTKAVLKMMGGRSGLRALMIDKDGKMKEMSEIMFGFGKRLNKIRDPIKRSELAMKVFGKRGVSVATTFANLTGDKFERYLKKLKEVRKETGQSARIMATEMLKTLSGQAKLLRSVTEAVNIEVFQMFSKELRGDVKSTSGVIGQFALALRVANKEKITDEKTLKQLELVPKSFFEAAEGVAIGINRIKSTLMSAFITVKEFFYGPQSATDGVKNTSKEVAAATTHFVGLAAVFGPLAIAGGLAINVMSGIGQAALGAARLVGSTFMLVAKGSAPILGKAASKIPKLGDALGKFGGVLGKVGKGAESLIAQPVKVVNFHELSLMMGGKGSVPTPGGAPAGSPGKKLPKGKGSRTPLFYNTLAAMGPIGALFNKNVGAIAKGTGTLASKFVGSAGILAAVGLVGVASFKLGQHLDKTWKISDKVSIGLWNLWNKNKHREKMKELKTKNDEQMMLLQAKRMATQFAQLSESGVSTITTKLRGKEHKTDLTQKEARHQIHKFLVRQGANYTLISNTLKSLDSTLQQITVAREKQVSGGSIGMFKPVKDAIVTSPGILPVSGGDVVLDRRSLAAGLQSQLRGGLMNRATGLGEGDPGMASPPPKQPNTLEIKIPLVIDGVKVAKAVARVQLDEIERSGRQMNPGMRRSLLERGYLGGG